MKVSGYWKNISCYFLLFVLSWGLTDLILYLLPLPGPEQGYGVWVFFALISSLLFLLILGVCFYSFSQGMRMLVGRFFKKKRLR